VILPQLSLGFTPRQLRIAYLHTQHIINNGSSVLCTVCENFGKNSQKEFSIKDTVL
jgi:hypothetical protein